ncbi:preprotein translocase subunit YajC [Tuwongella immobilis]|uniref:Sec translocon accessory complex subunit YajC n=1 Tax=Tuwongella immobilis TaxID=692036 RepID=A0A6C2YL02_9BACT|nr:preprotein translocase subunit YajC [Tuwongella immobilis]VIP02106.1 Uncharacterized protein OS=planctomycete KSU-1 GN=KSU1_B0674 PE=4 SV=1: YajC [Tuwongella immobilis]VTS00404.1 Uncharacterized protein OS=planctomycete KSU-1 GN=KSU1_B0674 PE=4 SV=1: YajC [Tuwongella immobilis]
MVMALILSGWLLLADVEAPAADAGAAPVAGAEGPAATGKQQQPPALFQFLPFILILGVFFVLQLRTTRQQQRQQQEMLAGLKKNDRVVTTSGIIGVIVGISEPSGNEPSEVTLRVDEDTKTRIKVLRTSIHYVLTRGDTDPAKS